MKNLVKNIIDLVLAVFIMLLFIFLVMSCAHTRLTKEDKKWLECIQRNGQYPYTWDTYQFGKIEFYQDRIVVDTMIFYGQWTALNRFDVDIIENTVTNHSAGDSEGEPLLVIQNICNELMVNINPELSGKGFEMFIGRHKLVH